MNKELPKVYEPQQVESRIYQMWEEHDCFKGVEDSKKKPFSIVMPPPNVTGQLHMGHALDCTLQDILTRFKRMQGYAALWVPGTDHAGIATQIKVEEELRVKEGKTRYDLGREKFLERVWKWKEEYGNRIVQQQKKMGVSCDWSRARFTMDEGCSKAVRETFCELYDKGQGGLTGAPIASPPCPASSSLATCGISATRRGRPAISKENTATATAEEDGRPTGGARFTMDEGCSPLRETFCELMTRASSTRAGIINWCPHCVTALSDAEVEYVDKPGYRRYRGGNHPSRDHDGRYRCGREPRGRELQAPDRQEVHPAHHES